MRTPSVRAVALPAVGRVLVAAVRGVDRDAVDAGVVGGVADVVGGVDTGARVGAGVTVFGVDSAAGRVVGRVVVAGVVAGVLGGVAGFSLADGAAVVGAAVVAATRDAALPGSTSVQNGFDVGASTASAAETITKHFTGESAGCDALAAQAFIEPNAIATSAPLVGVNRRSLRSVA